MIPDRPKSIRPQVTRGGIPSGDLNSPIYAPPNGKAAECAKRRSRPDRVGDTSGTGPTPAGAMLKCPHRKPLKKRGLGTAENSRAEKPTRSPAWLRGHRYHADRHVRKVFDAHTPGGGRRPGRSDRITPLRAHPEGREAIREASGQGRSIPSSELEGQLPRRRVLTVMPLRNAASTQSDGQSLKRRSIGVSSLRFVRQSGEVCLLFSAGGRETLETALERGSEEMDFLPQYIAEETENGWRAYVRRFDGEKPIPVPKAPRLFATADEARAAAREYLRPHLNPPITAAEIPLEQELSEVEKWRREKAEQAEAERKAVFKDAPAETIFAKGGRQVQVERIGKRRRG